MRKGEEEKERKIARGNISSCMIYLFSPYNLRYYYFLQRKLWAISSLESAEPDTKSNNIIWMKPLITSTNKTQEVTSDGMICDLHQILFVRIHRQQQIDVHCHKSHPLVINKFIESLGVMKYYGVAECTILFCFTYPGL